VQIAGKGYSMVINTDGFIVAHRDPALNGQNAADVYGQAFLTGIQSAKGNRMTANINGENCTLFIAPVMGQWFSVIVIGDAELLEETHSQLAINIMVSLIIFCLITFFYYIGYKNEQISSKKVEELNLQVITALATAIDAKDPYTRGHSTRVSQYAVMIAEALGWSRARIENLRYAALLHDIAALYDFAYVMDMASYAPVQDDEYRRNFYLGGHLNAAGYLLTSRMVAAYMDFIIRNHPEDFAQVGFIGGDVHYVGAKW
jgi:hypothetical protein